VISKLEQQKVAIDKAIEALREFEGGVAEQPRATKAVTEKPTKKRVMSEEGRQRIAAASRKRWAAVHRAAKKQAKKAA
jgi:hypothetical protein